MATSSHHLVAGKYKLCKRIDVGSFGQIFLGRSVENGEDVAIKLEPTSAKSCQLVNESQVYRQLQGEKGIPRLLWSGVKGDYNVLVTELLGSNLEELLRQQHSGKARNCQYCGFSLKTVLMLALQMLERIEFLHSHYFIHSDIKPRNFLMGLGKATDTVFMIDYGLSRKYITKTNEHIPYADTGTTISGTPRFSSVNSHLGIEQSRRDDLESLGYLLVYLMKGTLPWKDAKAPSKQQKYEKICEIKLSTTISSLCQGLPAEFSLYMEYCRALDYSETPDYQYLYGLFLQLLQSSGHDNDGRFDWSIPSQHPDTGNKLSSDCVTNGTGHNKATPPPPDITPNGTSAANNC